MIIERDKYYSPTQITKKFSISPFKVDAVLQQSGLPYVESAIVYGSYQSPKTFKHYLITDVEHLFAKKDKKTKSNKEL